MTNEVKKRLYDAWSACQAVEEFTAGKTLTDYREDLLLRSAVERQLEIVGEALGQAAEVTEALSEEVPDLSDIISFRNRIAHGYDSLDHEIVWDIVQKNVPRLRMQLEELLDR